MGGWLLLLSCPGFFCVCVCVCLSLFFLLLYCFLTLSIIIIILVISLSLPYSLFFFHPLCCLFLYLTKTTPPPSPRPKKQGCLNTYGRAGKLFPGPHLFVGAGLVVIWALSVFTIPAMQKGNDIARNVHIGANLAGLGLFAWQVQSGIPILLKVIEKTSWP